MEPEGGDLTIEEAANALGVTIDQFRVLMYDDPLVERDDDQIGRITADEVQRLRRAAARGEGDRLMSPAQVAQLFGVRAKTVTTWATQGRLACIRTLGGHRRYWESDVRRLLESNTREGPELG